MTYEEEREHKTKTICYLCHEKSNQKERKFIKVRDHCQYAGKNRGAAHLLCKGWYTYDILFEEGVGEGVGVG